MSPEQTRGAATLDHRSDIFSVGLVFYELISGKKAFPPARNLGDLVARIQHDPPPPLGELVPNLAPGVEDIVNRALQKQPEHRYQDLSAYGTRHRARAHAPRDGGALGPHVDS